MKTHMIIEDRGCGIQYIVLSELSYDEAFRMANEMNEQAIYDESLWNGNDDPFTYLVYSEDEYNAFNPRTVYDEFELLGE